MQFIRVSLTGVAVLALAACSDDPVSREVAPAPSASIRWVNAVPDTVAMDYRIVDYPSNASEPNLPFRGQSGNWRIVPGGSHHIKVFFTSTTAAGATPDIVSQVFIDTTLTLEVGKKYTIVHYGYAKAGASPKQHLIVVEDNLPTVGSGQIAFRAINAAPGIGAADVYATAGTATGGPATGTPLFSSVALGAATAWQNLTVAGGTDTYRLTATAPGSTAPLADVLAPAGSPAVPATATTAALDAIAGARQSQSAMTAVIFGPQVAYTVRRPDGTTVTTAAGTSGGIAVLLDVHPPRISP
jgi:uncharacterized protein DUF4397